MGESTLFVDDRLGLQVVNLALQEGLISSEEWTEALAQQVREISQGKPSRSFCAILLSRGILTRAQLGELRKKAEKRPERKPAPAEPPPGVTRKSATFGKYLLLHELGQGGRGVVYEALDQELNRRVALKLLRDAPGIDPRLAAQEREWFLRESRVTSTLPRHPSIVQVHETGVTRGTRYIAMELVHGLEMNRWAEGRDRKAQVSLLRDVARALHEAHEYGIVHRDLKPKNILVDAAGRPHVTDFGTSRFVRQDSRASLEAWGAVVGTALYMSPEQARDAASTDRRSDVYALGVLLYEALTGRPPFEGDTAFSTLLKAMKKELRRPSSVVDPKGPRAVDRTIESICLKAMARNPRDRYATAADLADDLEAWLSGTRVRAGFLPTRRPLAVGVGIAAATALCAVVLVLRSDPVPVPAPLPAPLSLAPGVALEGRGIRLREHKDARVVMTVLEGRPCAKLVRNADGFGLLPLDLDEAWAKGIAIADVEIEYFDADAPGAYFAVQYDSTEERLFAAGAYKWAGTLWLGGSRQWKRSTLRLANPRFAGRQLGGSDLRLFAGLSDLHVSQLTLRAVPPAEAAPPVPGRFKAEGVDAKALHPGLVGEYYSGTGFETFVARKVDPGIAFEWGDHSGPEGLSDRFSVRWTGYLRVPRTGRYLLETQSDNGVRLTIGGRPVIANWRAHASATDLALCDLEEGFHPFVLEYFEETGGASVLFSCLEEREGRMHPLGPDSLFHP